MIQTTYAVTGMTCGHCASSVREELGELPGVRQIDVDLGSGAVQVTSESALGFGQVEQAIRTAGYQLVR
ncbi:metal-binding protein [Amycolatopsis mediterranei S699]|uniref:Metal-binding protein n=2 Tax=Amycolatopsis mediterranei TaxID=33910 RepID=A0A9R0P2R3_AMYMS|nr:heavy metal-associated domain-containing protein [Amycolatopsis mediterranei]ADJ48259.1 putative metal-binding protein [Amycolatopsis mediterranei U32]AEK45170.1 metal-binding protein [Amycolatopsis mediterranei S699]AFO79970.1 metal-binding protein [Amycolatopsis mediterranei S699]AGT87098.1 metal-binding protein [Amycolatopsis mediterranei RB]KDO10414.1 heavy metal transporter [Amycolatopsis mediterranei]